jgi:dipeptidyl aminopeptidase/acylaminoacyl peptidase
MSSNIIHREEISLGETQTRMVVSGWGEGVIQNTVVEKITYLSDNLKVKGYLAYPAELPSGKKMPLIIWNRGGYGDKGAIDRFTARGMFGQLAEWGYAVLASQYRGNDGGEGKEQLGGSDLNDIKNLFPVAEELKFIDTSNAAVEGWSRGGMMSFLLLKEKYDFRCALFSGAISNLMEIAESNKKLKSYYRDIIGEDNFDDALKKRSAIYFVKDLPDIPYLIMHGGSDDMVPVQQSVKLAEKLSEEKRKYRLVIFEEGDHFLKNHRKEVDQLRKMWFEKYLGSQS